MTTLKNIIEGLDTLDAIENMDAKIDRWSIEIIEWSGERRITFRRDIQKPTEEEMKEMRETVGDD